MMLTTEVTVIDSEQNILDISVDVEWWVKAGSPGSKDEFGKWIDPPVEAELLIESITDDTGYDWVDELPKSVMNMIKEQCKKELEE